MNVIGRCKSIDGQKQKPENGCFTGFLASPARFERAAFRLGGGCSILLSYGSIAIKLSHSTADLPLCQQMNLFYLKRGMQCSNLRI